MAAFLLLWFLSLLVGFAFVSAIWPQPRTWRALLLRLALAVGPGIGISSVLFFLARAAGIDPPVWGYLAILAFLAALLLVIAAWRSGWKVGIERPASASGWRWLWLGCLILAVTLAANRLIGSVIVQPEGGWDAWAMWNMHARYLFQPGSGWLAMFDPALVAHTHPDYPLLTPAMIALGWRALGRTSTLGPLSVALVFTLATAGLLFAALNYQRKFIAACLAVIVVLYSGSLLSIGSSLYADVPLAYTVLGAVVCLYLYIKEGKAAWLVLSGVFCGLSVWTKNEGWSLLAATLAALLVAWWMLQRSSKPGEPRPVPGGMRGLARSISLFLAGGLIWLLATLYFKLAFTPPNDMFVSRTPMEVLSSLLTLARWNEINGEVLRQIGQYDGRIFVMLALVVLVLGLVKEPRLPSATGWLVLGLLLFQYMAIYAISPYGLTWHMDTSLPRLITHLYPSALFLVFTRLNLAEG